MIYNWLIIGVLLFCVALQAAAQERIAQAEDPIQMRTRDASFSSPAPEIIIRVTLPGAGVIDVIAYMRDTTLYLPLVEIFTFLQIQLEDSDNPARISGAFSVSHLPFLVDTRSHLIVLGDIRYSLAEKDFILGVTDCFLSTSMFHKVFGISAMYNEDQLLVTLSSDRPFPVQLEREREHRRKELQRRRQGENAVDLSLPRTRHLFTGGMLDWNAGYTQTDEGNAQQSIALRLGSEILGGDLTASFNAQSDRSVQWSSLPWKWRYTAEEAPYFRQANVGWMSTLLGQRYGMRGISLSNEWVYSRTEYGSDDIEGETDPGSDVELYRNGRLYDIAVADSEGRYRFTIPLRYGTNQFEVKEYPGSKAMQTQLIRLDVPGGFMPPGEIQYRISGGAFQPRQDAYVGEAIARYGLGTTMNVGGGVQYFTGIPDEGAFPAVFLDSRVTQGLFFSAMHHQGIMSMARMSLATPGDVRAEFNYLDYAGHLFFNFSGAKSEMRGGFAIPLYYPPFRSAVSFNGRLLQYNYGSVLNINTNLTAGIGTVNTQLTTYLAMTEKAAGFETLTAESILQISTPILRYLYLQGSAAYDYKMNMLTAARVNLSLQLTQDWSINAQWARSIRQNITQFQVDLQFQLPFIRLRSSGSYYNDGWQLVQRASGGIAWDKGANDLLFSDRSWVGRSAMSILPFMDANGNSELDEGENLMQMPVITSVRRSRRLPSDNDEVTRFVDMEQYAHYDLHIDAGSFADPLLVPRFREISLTADPNQFKPIYLPVYAGCEIAGEIRKVSGKDTLSEGGVRLWFRNAGTHQAEASAYSFSDGTYAHFGLAPGSWIVTPDSTQLRRRGLIAEPKEKRVTLRGIENGDFLTGVDFLLYPSGEVIERPEVIIDTLPTIAVIESDKPIAPPFPGDTTGVRPLPPIVDTTVSPPIAEADTLRPVTPAFVPVQLGVTEHLEIDLARSGLDSSTTAYLDRLVETARTADRYTITLEGHSDNFGSFSENQQRSQERAQRVLDYLLKKGIPRSRIQSQSFGSRQPLAPNTSASGRRRNNRADITLRGSIPTPPPVPKPEPRPESESQPRPAPRSDATPDSTVFRPPAVPADRPENVKSTFTLLINTAQTGLTAANKSTLDEVAQQVSGLGQYIIQVEGHSDNFGSFTESQQKSAERAKRAADYLVSRGIPREKLQIQAFGSRKPAASNRTAEGRRQNNRAEIRILTQ